MKMPRNNSRMPLLLSALIGLILISFATLPQAYASPVPITPTSGAAGYIATVSSGELTQVTADWNQPSITCQPSLPPLPGYAPSQIEFAGVIIANLTAGFGFSLFTAGGCSPSLGSPGYTAAFIALGTTGATVLPLVVTPGDKFSGSLTFSPSTGSVTADLTDLSTGQSASSTLPQSSSSNGFNAVQWIMIPGGTPGVGQNTLAEFNAPIIFSHCSATVSGNTLTIRDFPTVQRYTMVDAAGNTMATTSSLAHHGSSFRVTWVSST